MSPPEYDKKLNVAVLMGGIGQEREVSLESGRCVCRALEEASLEPIVSDIAPDNLSILDRDDIDVFFIALHGAFGEDGCLQQILDDRGLVYTGSGQQASHLAFDKWAAKECFTKNGIPTPQAILFDPQQDPEEFARQVRLLGRRYVVKPLRQGSTVGITIEDSVDSAIAAAGRCFEQFGDCMVEQYISGAEFTVGILADEPLPVIEIRTRTGFYDYQAKYVDDDTEFLFDTIDPAIAEKMQQAALACFTALGLRHFARVDFMFSDDGTAYVLEANTIPGMTTHSLVPKAAQKAGLRMSELCVKIIQEAMSSSDCATGICESGSKE